MTRVENFDGSSGFALYAMKVFILLSIVLIWKNQLILLDRRKLCLTIRNQSMKDSIFYELGKISDQV